MKSTFTIPKAPAILLLLLAALAQGCLSTAQPGYSGNSGYGNDPYNDSRYDDGYANDDYRDDVTYQNFYDELSPYGRWTNYPGYGQVWQPNAGPGFQPYATNGHWALTNYGWTWVSSYNWGWAPFHYGRWFFDDRFGWGWQPGYEWAPAWVTWGQYAGNYGWAPLGPGMSINISFGRIPRNSWCFVPGRYINQRNWSNYRVNNTTIINNVTIINNYGNGGRNGNRGGGFHRGPQVQDVQRYTRDRIRPLQVETVNRPDRQRVEGDRIGIYRPGARPNANGPSRNESADNNRPVTRPGNRYERPDDQPNTRPGSGYQRPGSPSRQNDDFNGSNRVGQANEGISQPDNAPVTRPGVERPGSPSRQNDSWNRPNRSDDPAVNRPGTSWERPQRDSRSGESGNGFEQPSRSDQSADRPMTRPGRERPGSSYGEGNRQPEVSRPERPDFGGGRSPERQARPDYPTQRSQPQIQSAPAPAQPRSEGTNQSSGGSERPGRSRGRGPN